MVTVTLKVFFKQKKCSNNVFFPLLRSFLVGPQNKYRWRKSSFFQPVGIWSLGTDGMGVLAFLWPVQRCPVLAFRPSLVGLHSPGAFGARLAASDRDPSFTTLASCCLGPGRRLLLEQQHKQSMTKGFEDTYKVKGKRCNQGPEKRCQSRLLRASHTFRYRNDLLSLLLTQKSDLSSEKKISRDSGD